jgi:hypothetical protein
MTRGDDGVRWIIHRGPRFDLAAASRGRLAPGGERWAAGIGWVPAGDPRVTYYRDRDGVTLPAGGQWLQVFTAVTA